jgi:HlyD family secretion protein
MRRAIFLGLLTASVLGGLGGAYVYAGPRVAAAAPAPSASAPGIYASGIVESDQSNGENVNLYPEVSGVITGMLVTEGQSVSKGAPLVQIDDTVQRALAEQLRSQAEAAQALLAELRAQPRKENLEVASAAADLAQASLKTAQDMLDKQQSSFRLAPESISKDALDNAINAQKVAQANLAMVARQLELTKAGAWVFDIRNQQKQAEALSKAYDASSALLAKYALKAPIEGVVMSIGTTVGSYVSPQGAYDTYTQGFDPVVVMSTAKGTLAVRCYIDEILISRIPAPDKMRAQMQVRGNATKIPLEFVRVQPYVSPKIQLSNERQEKVDLRVLPIIFRFHPPPGMQLFPGELVDVQVGNK